MGEKLITFETAKLAKEKEFDWMCVNYFQDSDRAGSFKIDNINNKMIDELHQEDVNCIIFYSAPSQSLLKKWLREKHIIDVEVNSLGEIDLYKKNSELIKSYTCKVSNWNVHWSVHDGTGIVMPEHYHFEGDNYEKVLELGLERALKLI